MKINGKIAVVTGAGSGIGRALALALSKEGARLALNDFNKQTLEETGALVEEQGGEAPLLVDFDVADHKKMHAFAEQVASHFGQVDIMINNAGVALGKVTAEDVEYEDFEWIMGINFWGMVYGSKAFLPFLKARTEASLVNISSLFGLIGIAYQAPYCTTKFAIRGFTESLRMEMLDLSPQVCVTSVHPGGIKTKIARSARVVGSATKKESEQLVNKFEQSFMKTTAEEAARVILKGIKKKKGQVIIGNDAKIPSLIARVLPSRYINIIGKAMKRSGI